MFVFLLTYFEANGRSHIIVYNADSKEEAANRFVKNIATPDFMYRIEIRQIAYVDHQPSIFEFEPVFDLRQTNRTFGPHD